MMIKKINYFVIVSAVLMAVGCSSIDSDAKKAAALINKSLKYSHELKFEKAENSYTKAKEIITKYNDSDSVKTAEFYEHFANYRDKEKR